MLLTLKHSASEVTMVGKRARGSAREVVSSFSLLSFYFEGRNPQDVALPRGTRVFAEFVKLSLSSCDLHLTPLRVGLEPLDRRH